MTLDPGLLRKEFSQPCSLHIMLEPYATFLKVAQNVSRTTPAMCRRRVYEDAGTAFSDNDD